MSHFRRTGRARRTLGRPAGQALVETALGILLIITILLVGMYFAEVGFWSMKVQESVNFALWDATGRRMHQRTATTQDYSLYKSAVTSARKAAQNRYKDFDAVRSGGGATVDQVVTRVSALRLTRATCNSNLDGTLSNRAISPLDAVAGVGAYPLSDMKGAKGAGISCNASALMRGFRVPARFLDNKPFEARNFKYRTRALRICAIGRASGSGCRGSIQMLLDDWGLSTVQEGNECPVQVDSTSACGSNPGYYNWVKSAFQPTGSAGMALAGVVGADGIDDGQFFMSYRGHESGYKEHLAATAGNEDWETTSWQQGPVQYPERKKFWLGDPLK